MIGHVDPVEAGIFRTTQVMSEVLRMSYFISSEPDPTLKDDAMKNYLGPLTSGIYFVLIVLNHIKFFLR